MNLVRRVKSIILKPKLVWSVISQENNKIDYLLKNYLLKLALIPAFAHIIGYGVFGYHQTNVGFDTSFFIGIKYAFVIYVTIVCSIFVSAWIISQMASLFGTEKNLNKAFELVVYAYTPMLFFSILNISTSMHSIVDFMSLFGLIVLYHGFIPMLKVSEEKQVTYYILSSISIITVFVFILKIFTLIIIGNVVEPV
ncbi:MAG: hypothetical protein A2X13_08510 [Bacteroidetes bacterium GWC2_33_15]|nr:MAG: hypothetical protein A2X10_10340 [Bacteroidetes bacterium GWA2_33_15]OFX51494.1 MAG: hypothetical protein A2X13_08510 [Bacteroidetes bacterium GWC2_33_15]OFX65759.1 MAG: hypothetical protein A2X15_13265 [Bacteroidetes bacterium GWB2_32_14]OFX69522.1 MAG: hypothetical protein A2X14_10090 [Bacteroidetes bacterium GWD2_33_33]HAN17782.1 hypothetical protein [Bacteroidales bacterium]